MRPRSCAAVFFDSGEVLQDNTAGSPLGTGRGEKEWPALALLLGGR
jgi:hypothetical protein